jgi:hypothetical protein
MLRGGLEHLKIKTRLIDEMFASVMGECVKLHCYESIGAPSLFKVRGDLGFTSCLS